MARKSATSGFNSHKPECTCNPCKARRRKAEALASGDRELIAAAEGPGTHKSAAINKSLPPIVLRDNTIRGRVADYAAMLVTRPELTIKEAAQELGISPRTLSNYLKVAHNEGWLLYEDPVKRLETEVVPKVIDNLVEFLEAKDKTVTIEAAKGTVFPMFKDQKTSKEVPQGLVGLKIDIVYPEGYVPEPKQITGTTVGVGKSIEGEILPES